MPSKKLTPAMQKIIDLLCEGWELGHSGGINPHVWAQKGGIGRGGESVEVNFNTFFALRKRGLVKSAGSGPGLSTRYLLEGAANDER